jgi:hypothetical protein
MNSSSGEWCEECDIGKGCKIYDTTIPEKCKRYQCGYAQMEKIKSSLRPDRCKVIFEKVTDDIFLGLMQPFSQMQDVVKEQVNVFLQQGYSVMLHSHRLKKPFIFPTENTTASAVYETVKAIHEEFK